MPLDKISKNYKLLLAALLLATICRKFLCYPMWAKTEFPDDSTLVAMSLLYYSAAAILCFFGGRVKRAPIIFSAAFLSEILIMLAAVMCKAYTVLRAFMASHYSVMRAVNLFEDVGQTLPEVIYIAAISFAYFVLVLISAAGNRILNKKSE